MERVKKERVAQYIEALEHEESMVDLDLVEKKRKADCDEWTEKVFRYIQKQQFDHAYELFYGIWLDADGQVNQYFEDTTAAILDFMFRVYRRECENNTETVFQRVSSLEEMRHFYFELKFLIWRFEYDLPVGRKEELNDFLDKYPVSCYAMIEMVNASTTQKEKVLNEIAVFLLKKGRYGYVLPLLSAAYDNCPENRETLYNLSYFLYAVNEVETALEFMDEIHEEWEDADRLREIIGNAEKLPPYDKLHKMNWGSSEKIPYVSRPEKQEKICFITCVNDERLYQESCYYIDNLRVPDGYVIEKLPMFGAVSMASGYQEAMQSTDAKYKIYLHQDVFCTDRNLLYEALHVFEQDSTIGMMGVAGSKSMVESGVWWEAKEGRYYNLYQDSVETYGGYDRDWSDSSRYGQGDYQEVSVIDGVFMMTSKDVDWREDLFDDWHFYDISQSMEFWQRDYKVVILRPDALWVLHCGKCGDQLGNSYRSQRIRFLKEYMQDLIAGAVKEQCS